MRKGARVTLWAAVLAVAAPLALAQDPVKPLEEQIDLSKGRLDEIQREKQRLRTEMEALAAQVHDVRAELDNLDRQATNQETLLREMDHQLAIRDQQVAVTTADLLRTQDQLTEKKVLFARRARDLYKRGALAQIQVLLAAEANAAVERHDRPVEIPEPELLGREPGEEHKNPGPPAGAGAAQATGSRLSTSAEGLLGLGREDDN